MESIQRFLSSKYRINLVDFRTGMSISLTRNGDLRLYNTETWVASELNLSLEELKALRKVVKKAIKKRKKELNDY